MDLPKPTILEGSDILQVLGRSPYYQTHFIRTQPVEIERWDKSEWITFKIPLEPGPPWWLYVGEPGSNLARCCREHLREGETYVMSVYNIHHQQLINLHLFGLHFNSTRKEVIMPHLFSQRYPGCWDCEKNEYDDFGNVTKSG